MRRCSVADEREERGSPGLGLRVIQAVQNVAEVQVQVGWMDVPGIAKDPNTGVVVQRELVACIV